jgi:hypothetical protein
VAASTLTKSATAGSSGLRGIEESNIAAERIALGELSAG